MIDTVILFVIAFLLAGVLEMFLFWYIFGRRPKK